MQKQSFIKIIDALKAQNKREAELAASLSRFFDGHIIPEISSDFQAVVLGVLEVEMDDPAINSEHGSIISWWMYEYPISGEVPTIRENGEEIRLETPGQLYDYLAKNNN